MRDRRRGARARTALAGMVPAALFVMLLLPAPAHAQRKPLGLTCTPQAEGVRFCPGDGGSERVPSFDGVPLDVDVTLPPTGDGPFPTIVMLHGWGNTKTAFESKDVAGNGYNAGAGTYLPPTYGYNNHFYAREGYAVVTYSARGRGASCGGGGAPRAQLQTGPCAGGFIRLADQRYEARDTQHLLGLLVDEGITRADAIGVTGISYGGGQSLELAYLKDRVRCPGGPTGPGDPCAGRPAGALVRWRSPRGTPLSIAASHPRWFWSDLVASLLPNGRFLDFDPQTAGLSRTPIGVEIESFLNGLYATGTQSGYVVAPQPPGSPLAPWDLSAYAATFNAGEPYGARAKAIADEIAGFHQGYGTPGRVPPAPLLLESGWNDELFPVTESLRVYNDLLVENPAAEVSLLVGDVGHSRASNKATVNRAFNDATARFFARHLRGTAGRAPVPGSVLAYTTTCPSAASGPPDGGPFTAPSWAALHPGSVRLSGADAQTVRSPGGSPHTAAAFDPIASADGCRSVPAETAPGTATYTLQSRGFTLLGLPTIRASIATAGDGGQLDGRLWDVSPDGRQLLVTRGAYRLLDDQSGAVTFQLHGNGYRFAAGHTVKLELLGQDRPYFRASNAPFQVTVEDLTLELPAAEAPGTTAQIEPATPTPHAPRPCAIRRRIRISLPHRRGARVLSVRIGGPGRRTRVLRGRRVRGRALTLSNDRAGELRVSIRIARGRHPRRVVTRTRRVQACTPRRSHRDAP